VPSTKQKAKNCFFVNCVVVGPVWLNVRNLFEGLLFLLFRTSKANNKKKDTWVPVLLPGVEHQNSEYTAFLMFKTVLLMVSMTFLTDCRGRYLYIP